MPLSMEEFDTLLLSGAPDVQFQIDIPPEMLQGMTGGGTIAPRISRAQALQVPAVLRSRNLIAGTLASLPIHIKDSERREAKPTTLLDQIDPDVANVVTIAQTYEDLLFESTSWWRVLERGWHGYPTFAEHINVSRVYVSGGAVLPTVNGQLQILGGGPGRVFIDGVPVRDQDVIRFDSANPPLLVHAARAIRACLQLDTTAATYADEPIPMSYFTPKEGSRVNESDEAIQRLLDKWAIARRQRATGYVPGTVELKALQFNAEQIQLAQQRQHAVLEIARAAGVDPEDLGVSTTSRTYQNAEQRRQDLIDFTFKPYVSAIEQRLSMGDVTPRGYTVKVNYDGFLRSDTKTRFEAHEVALTNGFETLNEVRELEDRPNIARQSVPVPSGPMTPQEATDAGSNGSR